MLERLRLLEEMLSQAGASVSLRGCGTAAFVFAENEGRAIEASINNDDWWWIQLWEVDDDENAPPVNERTILFDHDAFRASAEWLKLKEG